MKKTKTFQPRTASPKVNSSPTSVQTIEQTDTSDSQAEFEYSSDAAYPAKSLNGQNLLLLQRAIGNQAVMRMIQNSRAPKIAPAPAISHTRPHIIGRKTAGKVVQ